MEDGVHQCNHSIIWSFTFSFTVRIQVVVVVVLLVLPSMNSRGCRAHTWHPVSLRVPPANRVSDAFGKRRPVGRCGEGSVTAGTTGCGWVGWCRFWGIITQSSTARAKVVMLQLINDLYSLVNSQWVGSGYNQWHSWRVSGTFSDSPWRPF